MTDKGPYSSSVWIIGNILKAADLLDSLKNTIFFNNYNTISGTQNTKGIIAHSSSIWSAILENGAIYNSTNTGVSWTSKNTDLDKDSFIRVCKADSTHAVFCEYTGTAGEVAFTSDSGATVTTKTSTAFGTAVYDVAFGTAGLIVVGGDDAAGTDHIVFSTDDAGTWTNATTSPSSSVYSVDMFSATIGFAIDSSQKIWKTTDGAVNWVDTTHTVASTLASDSTIYCISATSFIHSSNGYIEYYDATGNATIKAVSPIINSRSGGICKNTTGDYFSLVYGHGTNGTGSLFKSSDGITWKVAPIGFFGNISANNVNKCFLNNCGTDLLISVNRPGFIGIKQDAT